MTNTTKTALVSGIIALVVALAVGFGFYSIQTSPTASLGAVSGPVTNVPSNFTNGLSLGAPEVTFSAGGVIAAGANRVAWTNKTGRPVYVNQLEISTIGPTSATQFPFYASSTEFIYAFATSSTAVLSTTAPQFDFAAPVNNASTTLLVNNFKIATGTAATSTSSLNLVGQGDSDGIIQPGGSVVIVLQSQTGCASSGSGVCESATSTNRGFNLRWYLGGHYAP